MGVDMGFDLFPPIDPDNIGDTAFWEIFLEDVATEYHGDPNIEVRENGDIVCKQGEHPILLKEGHKFRRFASKVSGSHAGSVAVYLKGVFALAKVRFPGRVYYWSDYGHEGEPRPIYGWDEVYEARK